MRTKNSKQLLLSLAKYKISKNFVTNGEILTNNLPTKKPIVVIIPSYNNIKWYEKNLSMLFAQNKNYKNWRAIYIDDCSTDFTGQAVEKYLSENKLGNKVTLIKNPQNMGAMHNWYNAIHSCKDNEIIVSLDGDDWFANDSVLKNINSVYQNKNIWMTYGQYKMYPNGTIGICKQIPNKITVQNSFRDYEWLSSHLRTFYAGLFKKIKKEDFMLDDKFIDSTCDMAIMFPLLEMAGDKAIFTPEVLYVYNTANTLNDYKVRLDAQLYLNKYIREKERYNKLNSLE